MIGAVLFSWVQGATFYRDLHKTAVDSIPTGSGKTWLDVGCGPGLVSRLAAAQNFAVVGIDYSPSMIVAARLIATWKKAPVRFEVGDLASLLGREAHVVSAASLLAVLPDKEQALKTLWNCVLPKGHLLIIEPTDLMNPANARNVIKNGLPKGRTNALKLWSKARANRAVDPNIFDTINAAEIHCLPLLSGLVKAWILTKA